MKIRCTSITLLFLIAFSELAAQSDQVIIRDDYKIEPNRYKGIKGSPYLFNDFVSATILDKRRQVIENVKINYNGEAPGFEVESNGDIIALDETQYIKMVIASNNYDSKISDNMTDTTVFIKALHPKELKKFFILVYAGKSMSIFKKFEVSIVKRKVETFGQTEEFNDFSPKFLYWIVRNGRVEQINLNKKSVLGAIAPNKEVTSYVKKNKLKIKSEKELIQLLRYIDSL